MELEYRQHARLRMIEKNVTEEMIEAILANPRWMPATTRGTRYDAVIEGRRLAVIVDEEQVTPRVVTVFWP